MVGKIKSFSYRLMVFLNCIAIAVMFFLGYAGRFDPVVCPGLTTLTLAFPIALAVNIAFLSFWVVARLRMVWLPVLGFVVCFFPVRSYSPFNLRSVHPDGAIKVLSYNVQGFGFAGGGSPGPEDVTQIIQYMANSGADIVCLQEAQHWRVQEELSSTMDPKYPYYQEETKDSSGDVISIFSRYPIVKSEVISYQSYGNISAAYWLNINGQEVIVVNNHLESNLLSEADKAGFKGLVKGKLVGERAEGESRLLFDKLELAAKKRAPQAVAVHRFIDKWRKRGKSIIVCGDFNDNPLSYVRQTIARNLTDCYISSGNGPGWSYHKSGMFVRIDNLLCTNDWEPYEATVDNKVAVSDHYPIYCWLKKRVKP